MGRQDLAYAIHVNDAELRLATNHVKAFNAELAATTLTGRKVDEQMRSTGRKAVQVGNFAIRNLTIPAAFVAFATGRASAQFETALSKIQGITNTTAKDTQKLGDAALRLSDSTITEGPNALVDAMFELQSVGFKTNQTIAAMGPIAKASAVGLGQTRTVANAVAAALDAYGIAGQNASRNSLSAASAVGVLIGTINAGLLPPEELAGSIGRVIPLANAMGVSFDQVGASVAAMTRQGLNANLAVTALRAFLSQIARAQPTTQKAFAAIGTSTNAVQAALRDPKIGLFGTAVALRGEFDKLGKVKLSNRTLREGLQGDSEALAEIKAKVGQANEALSKAFPNVRALTALLILTGPRKVQNATIFAQLEHDATHAQQVIKRAYEAKLNTPFGRLQLELSKLKTTQAEVGDTFINAGAGFLHFINNVSGFVRALGPAKPILKDLALGLLLFGPITSLFGRLTQGLSGGITLLGRWQERATQVAYAMRGINIEQDKEIIASRNATAAFEANMAKQTAAANRTAAAVSGIGIAATGVRAQLAGATGGAAVFGKVSGRSKTSAAAAATAAANTTGSTPLALLPFARTPGNIDSQLDKIQARRLKQLAAARAERASAQAAVAAAEARVNLTAGVGASGAAKAAAAELARAKATLASASASAQEARMLARVGFQDQELITLTKELSLARLEQVKLTQRGATISAAAQAETIAGLEQEILMRKRLLAGQQLALGEQGAIAGIARRQSRTPPLTGGFAGLDTRTKEIQGVAVGAATGARIMATKWGAAIEGMKSTAALGFNFIALIFATELVGKIIFDSDKTKKAVTSDLTDINKAGAGAAAGLLAAGVALTSFRGSAGALAGAGGLAGIGAKIGTGLAAATLGTKLKLIGAGLIALQFSGVKTETIFNAAMLGMLARTVALRVGMSGLATSAIGLRLGLAGISSTGVGAVVALAAIAAQTNAGARAARTATGAFGDLMNILQTGHPSKGWKEFFIGAPGDRGWLGNKLFPESETERAARKAKEAAKKIGKATNVDDQLFKSLEAGLQRKGEVGELVKLAEQQRDLGRESAAEALLAQARAKQMKNEMKAAVAFLRSHGKDDVANLLDPTVKKLKTLRKDMDAFFDKLESGVTGAFDARTDRMLDAFDRNVSNRLDAFDEATSKLEDKLKVSVKTKNASFTITVNGKTPAERELEALDKIEEKRNFRRDLFDARQELGNALQIGDPGAIRAAQRKLEDAQSEQKKFGLTKRADTERKAADLALDNGKKALDKQRKAQRQSLEDGLAAERRNLTAMRSVQKDNLQSALDTQQKLFDSGKIGLGKYQSNVLAIMKRYGVSFGQAGHDAGKAYADAMVKQFAQLNSKVQAQLDALVKKAQDTKTQITAIDKKIAKGIGALVNPGVPGAPGAPTQLTPAKVAAGQQTNLTPAQIATRNATITAHEKQVAINRVRYDKTHAGVPKRAAILKRLHEISVDWSGAGRADERKGEEFDRYVPKQGAPSFAQYHEFIDALLKGVQYRPKRLVSILRGNLLHDGFVRAATGAVVPGQGVGDTVPAMLTPGELVLNHRQQSWLAQALGMPGASPHALFGWISKNGSRYADGGVVSEHGQRSSGLPPIAIPGLADLAGALKKLVVLMAKSSIRSDQNAPGTAALMNELALGGTLRKDGTIAPDTKARLAHLRKTLNPTHSTDLLRQAIPGFDKLPVEARRAAEASVAQNMAHPVRAGLFTPHADGPDTLGGPRTLRRGLEATAIGINAFGGSEGGGMNVGDVTIIIQGENKSPNQIAREVASEFKKTATHTVRRRRGYEGRH